MDKLDSLYAGILQLIAWIGAVDWIGFLTAAIAAGAGALAGAIIAFRLEENTGSVSRS